MMTPAHLSARSGELLARLHSHVFGSGQYSKAVMAALLARGHVLLEGLPGMAKTTLAKTMASLLGLYFKRIQFSADLMPQDVVGNLVPSPDFKSYQFVSGPIFTNLLLADEINRASPKALALLLEAMEEGQVTTIDGNTRSLPVPFMIIATQNPHESGGTYTLPDAVVDRFLVRVRLSYPESEEELSMLRAHQVPRSIPSAVWTPEELLAYQALVDRIHVSDTVYDYVVRLIRSTRNDSSVSVGASPRAGLALIRASKALAAIEGMEYVTPDHVRTMTPAVLGHRLRLTPAARRGGAGPDSVLERICRSLPLAEASG